MFKILDEALAALPDLIQTQEWESLWIDYEEPNVERLWTSFGENRVYLHRLLPCTKMASFWHSHPWPSAMRVLKGEYEMGLSSVDNPEEIATFRMVPGSSYQMVDKSGMHYVKVKHEVLSVMVTGPLFDNHLVSRSVPKMGPLVNGAKMRLLDDIHQVIGDLNVN